MKKRLRPAILAAATALAVLAIGAWVPIWTVTDRDSDVEYLQITTRASYQSGPFWAWPQGLFRDHAFRRQNAIQTVLIVGLAIGVGVLAYRAALPRSRCSAFGDYEEKPNGSIPDGRG